MLKRVILYIAFSGVFGSASAQFRSVSIGIDGLTCSACSFATQKSILTLDFVDTVIMDLNTTISKVTFKKGKAISIDALANKIQDAGFTVRSMQAVYDFNNVTATENSCSINENGTFQFIGLDQTKVLGSNTTIKFLGSSYCSKKEFKKWTKKLKSAKACENENRNIPHYFVTL